MLILITGGAWQGKSAFARTFAEQGLEFHRELTEGCAGAPKGKSDEALGGESDGKFAILEDVHLLVKDALRQGHDPREEITGRIRPHANVILTVNELGCGIVPMEAFDREWRELTGRICCELARQADAVYRVTCGIATRIK